MRVVHLARPAPGFAIGNAPAALTVPGRDAWRMFERIARAIAHGLLQILSVLVRLTAVCLLAGTWALAFVGAIAVSIGFAAGVLVLMSGHFN